MWAYLCHSKFFPVSKNVTQEIILPGFGNALAIQRHLRKVGSTFMPGVNEGCGHSGPILITFPLPCARFPCRLAGFRVSLSALALLTVLGTLGVANCMLDEFLDVNIVEKLRQHL